MNVFKPNLGVDHRHILVDYDLYAEDVPTIKSRLTITRTELLERFLKRVAEL